MERDEFDRRVRVEIYRRAVEDGRPPRPAEVANAVGAAAAEVEEAYRRLADAHVIVLEPGSVAIRMVNPFSAAPTPFRVETPRRAYWGNCAWDALGIAAALGTSATVRTPCPDGCGTEIVAEVEDGARLRPLDAVAHFAIPAPHWWDDIVFT